MAFTLSSIVRLMSSTDAVVPPMAWEHAVANTLDMSHSQTRFIVAVFAALPLSFGMRALRSPTLRNLYSLVTGFLLVIYPFGQGIYQLVFPVVVTYAAMAMAPRHCVPVTWVAVFGYLIWLQVITASGMAWNEGALDFVGAIMIVTLKLIPMAHGLHDGRYAKPESLNDYNKAHAFVSLPAPLTYLSFVFACGNLLAGPPIEYCEWVEFIELRGVWDRRKRGGLPADMRHGVLWMVQALGFMAMHIVMISKLDWGITNNFWFRREPYVSLPLPQIKYYFLWKMAESANVLAGFDFAGWQSDGSPQWGRCTNVRFLGMWLSDSASIVPTHWNIRTGIFLKRYVYERLVGQGRPGFVQILLTQLVAAFWHGVYPGYIIFFVGTVFYLQSARTIYRAEVLLLPPRLVRSRIWWLLKVVWTDTAVCYMSMAFVLLEWETSIEIHRDVYFLPHIIMFILCAVGALLPSASARKEKKQ